MIMLNVSLTVQYPSQRAWKLHYIATLSEQEKAICLIKRLMITSWMHFSTEILISLLFRSLYLNLNLVRSIHYNHNILV
jgi:hypothetical protein